MKNAFDHIKSSQPVAEPQQQFEPVSGCPVCHQTTTAVTVGRQRVEVCTEHRLYWLSAVSPCSPQFAELESAFDQHDVDQRKDWAAMDLDNFQKVQPWFLGQREATA